MHDCSLSLFGTSTSVKGDGVKPELCLGSNIHSEKRLNIPKGLSKSVNRRRTDNTMTKRTNNDLQNTTQKTNDQVTRAPLKTRTIQIQNT